MALLSNMSIERTIGQMSSSSGSGGYRYLGGDGISVDNDLYKISVDYNSETLTIDSNSRLTFDYTFLQAGDNITLQYEGGHLIINAAMFQSQFESGDKAKYDLACLNLGQAQLDIITINGNISTINNNISAISGENGLIDQLDGRIDTLESHDTDHETRIGTLESHDTDHETRLGAAEATILAHTDTISANDQRSRANATAIETIQGTIETLTGYSGDIGNLAERMTAAEGSIGTNADNIASNLLLIQGNASDISAINTAIDTPETGYAARIADAENGIATNLGLIQALNARVNVLDPQGAEPGETLADRVSAVEDNISSLQSAVDGYQTTFDSMDTTVSGLSGDISGISDNLDNLSSDVSAYETATDGRLDILEDFQVSASSDIDNLEAADTAIDGRLDDLEAFQTSASGRLDGFDSSVSTIEDNVSSLQTSVGTNTGDISDLQTTVGGHTSSISELQGIVGEHTTSLSDLPSMSSTLSSHSSDILDLQTAVSTKELKMGSVYYNPAPTPSFTAVQNSDPFDPDCHYYFSDTPTYSQYYPVTVSVESSDAYDSSKTYYSYDEQNDQWTAYTYVDDPTFTSDIESLGLVYLETPSEILYESDGASGYQLFSGTLNPSDVYYTQDSLTFSDRYMPEISKVASGTSYDSSVTYFTIDIRGNIAAYTYVDSNTFDADVASGLYYVSNWTAAIVEGLYKQTFSGVSPIFHIPTPLDGIATISSGIGNKITVDVNYAYKLSSVADSQSETTITFPVASGSFIECTITASNNGTGVRGNIYVQYFGTAEVSDPDIQQVEPVEPGNEEPGNEEPGNEEPGNEEPGNEEPPSAEP